MTLHPDLLSSTRLPLSHPTSDNWAALPNVLRNELIALRSESDPELRDEGLLSLARRLDQRGRADLAAELCLPLAEGLGPLQARARAELELLQGRGEVGRQTERWLRDFTVQATDPATLLAMGTAGTVFRTVRLATLARLQSGPWRGSLARGAAALTGLSLEAPAFTLTARGASELLDRPLDWSGEALGRDLASSYLTLAGLRGAGALGQGLLRRLPAGMPASLSFRWSLGQGSLLGGILLAHSMEVSAGLRPETSAGQTMAEGLATLLHFQVAGRLSRAAFGRNFQAWEQGLDLQAETLSRPRFRGPGQSPFSLEPAFAEAGIFPSASPSNRGVDFHILKMSGSGESQGPRSSPRAPAATSSSAAETSATTAFLEGMSYPKTGLRAFLHALPVAATVSQFEGPEGELRVVATNPAFLQLFGQTEQKMSQRPLNEFLALGSHPISASQMWNMVRGGVFKATAMEFETRVLSQKIWASGLIRTVYGQEFAFTFYAPRSEGRSEPPSIPEELKALQLADGMRQLDLDSSGYFELRSSLELGLQISNPSSHLMRELKNRDLRMRIMNYEPTPIATLGPALAKALAHFERQFSFPAGRSLFIEQMWQHNLPDRTLHLKVGRFGFAPTNESAPPSAAAPVPRTFPEPGPATSARFEPGSLVENVRKTLEGILSPHSPPQNDGTPPKPREK